MDKIEKIKEWLKPYLEEDTARDEHEEGFFHCAMLLNEFLDTLSEELDKSLEAEIQWYLREKCSGDDEPTVSEIARYFAKWQYQKDREEFAKIRAKIWCEGFDAHNEQMLKNAVEGEVYKFGEVAYVKERNNAELTKYLSQFNNGDKVRIVVLKEEE